MIQRVSLKLNFLKTLLAEEELDGEDFESETDSHSNSVLGSEQRMLYQFYYKLRNTCTMSSTHHKGKLSERCHKLAQKCVIRIQYKKIVRLVCCTMPSTEDITSKPRYNQTTKEEFEGIKNREMWRRNAVAQRAKMKTNESEDESESGLVGALKVTGTRKVACGHRGSSVGC